MQKYVLSHGGGERTQVVDGRRLSLQRLGRSIICDEPVRAAPARASRRRQFDDVAHDESTATHDGRQELRHVPPPYRENPSPLRAPEPYPPRPARLPAPAMRESREAPPRRVRRAVGGIEKWQETDYDLLNPDGAVYADAAADPPRVDAESAKERFKRACFGGGAGASMGLLRHVGAPAFFLRHSPRSGARRSARAPRRPERARAGSAVPRASMLSIRTGLQAL